jgi:hypothetical protein
MRCAPVIARLRALPELPKPTSPSRIRFCFRIPRSSTPANQAPSAWQLQQRPSLYSPRTWPAKSPAWCLAWLRRRSSGAGAKSSRARRSPACGWGRRCQDDQAGLALEDETSVRRREDSGGPASPAGYLAHVWSPSSWSARLGRRRQPLGFLLRSGWAPSRSARRSAW